MSISRTTNQVFQPTHADDKQVVGSLNANVGSARDTVPTRRAASMTQLDGLITEAQQPTDPSTFSPPNPPRHTTTESLQERTIEDLPDELLLQIGDKLDFQALARLGQTNRRFNQVLSEPRLVSEKMIDAIPALTQTKKLSQLLAQIEKLPSPEQQKFLPALRENIKKELALLTADYVGNRKKDLEKMEPVLKKFFDLACNNAQFDGGDHMAAAIVNTDVTHHAKAKHRQNTPIKLESFFVKREAMMKSGVTLDSPTWDYLRTYLSNRLMRAAAVSGGRPLTYGDATGRFLFDET